MNGWTHAGTYSDAMDGMTPVVAFPINVSGRPGCNFSREEIESSGEIEMRGAG